jgi:hypothetical protein
MPSYKLPNPKLEYQHENDEFMLLYPYATPEIIVAKDFVTDGVSSPWWARFFFPRYDKTLPAAIVHDWCYGGYMSRKNADKLFKKNLKRLGINRVHAYIMYLAVRIGGRSHYTRRQDEGLYPNALDNLLPDQPLKGFDLP